MTGAAPITCVGDFSTYCLTVALGARVDRASGGAVLHSAPFANSRGNKTRLAYETPDAQKIGRRRHTAAQQLCTFGGANLPLALLLASPPSC
jgi:hypothetical protein